MCRLTLGRYHSGLLTLAVELRSVHVGERTLVATMRTAAGVLWTKASAVVSFPSLISRVYFLPVFRSIL